MPDPTIAMRQWNCEYKLPYAPFPKTSRLKMKILYLNIKLKLYNESVTFSPLLYWHLHRLLFFIINKHVDANFYKVLRIQR